MPNVKITSSYPLKFDQGDTLVALDGDTLNYGNSSTDLSLGTLAPGSSMVFSRATWVQSAGSTNCFLVPNVSSIVGSETFAENKKLILTSNTPAGGISRMIEFRMTTTYDRPWLSWFDENARHRAAIGYHTTDASEGGVHQAFELKTVADAAGSFPNDMRTRFSIGTNSDRVLVGFNYVDLVEVNQGEVPATPTPSGLSLRAYKRDGSASFIAAQFVAQVETTDATTVFIDAIPNNTAQPGQIILMKSSISSSGSTGIYIKSSNSGSPNANQWIFKNRTGVLEIYNAQTVPAANVTGGGALYANAGALVWRGSSGTITTIAPA